MSKRRYTAEEIINKLREVEILTRLEDRLGPYKW